MNREKTLEKLRKRSKPWDVVIIGGGATGAGCCLDAASRGLDVLLVEAADFGKGTSSRSTKLIHGGVRYLEQGNVRMVRESLVERGRLIANAPHLVSKQEFILPCASKKEAFYYAAGLKVYDLLAGKWGFGKSKYLSQTAAAGSIPAVDPEKFAGGVRYFDGRFDDTKLLLALLRTASNAGASIINYAIVTEITKDSSEKASGVRLKCQETGEEFKASAKVVINATGLFADNVRKLSNTNARDLMTHSQGIHLVFDGELWNSEKALIIPKTTDGRVLFAIPFYGRTLVGTTDTPVEHADAEPRALEEEIDFVLETCAEYFKIPPQRTDIRSVFAGIRPLVLKEAGEITSKISRRHLIDIDKSGLVTVTGGKWTTYRRMAEDAVNAAAKSAGINASPSKTQELRIAEDPEFDSLGLEQRLSEEFEWTVADVVSSVRHEMARTVEDVLARRTRILFLDAREAIKVSPFTAELIASELGRDSAWAKNEVHEFGKIAAGYLPKRS